MNGRSLFVLGGARSGKSRYAQARAEALKGRHFYIATAEAFDDEMRARIAQHRDDRDARWQTVEAPLDLVETLDTLDAPDAVVLVDCLTLWTSNLLLAERDIVEAAEALAAAIPQFSGHLILVANEVGLGIVPENALARRFRDEAGHVNQIVAATAAEVQIIFSGLPMRLK